MAVTPLTPLDDAGYTPAVTRRVYRELTARALAALKAGHSVIADAVFARPEDREAIAQAARAAGVPFLGLWLDAPPAIARATHRRSVTRRVGRHGRRARRSDARRSWRDRMAAARWRSGYHHRPSGTRGRCSRHTSTRSNAEVRRVLDRGIPRHSPCGEEPWGRVVSGANRLRHVGGDVARVPRQRAALQCTHASRPARDRGTHRSASARSRGARGDPGSARPGSAASIAMNAFSVCARGPTRPPVLNTNAWSSSTGMSRYLARWRTCESGAAPSGSVADARAIPPSPGSSAASLVPRSRRRPGPTISHGCGRHMPSQRLHLVGIGFSRHHDHRVAGLSNRRVERGNAVGDEDVAGELGIDQRRVAGAQAVVRFVEQDLVWQPGVPPQRH